MTNNSTSLREKIEAIADKFFPGTRFEETPDMIEELVAAVQQDGVEQPRLTIALPDYERRRIEIVSDEMLDDERLVCVAIVDAAPRDEVKVEAVAEVESFTSGSYHRNYKLTWRHDVPAGTKLFTYPPDAAARIKELEAKLNATTQEWELFKNSLIESQGMLNESGIRERELRQQLAATSERLEAAEKIVRDLRWCVESPDGLRRVDAWLAALAKRPDAGQEGEKT